MNNISEIIQRLFKCPVCGSDMYTDEQCRSAYCRGSKRHCFDFSSDGYVSMSGRGGGDPKPTVSARRMFLSSGYYLPAAEEIKAEVKRQSLSGSLVDAGCGEGYYTSMLSEKFESTVGFDLSKFACSYGAKQAKHNGKDNLLYATASVFEMPLKDNICDCVTNIFAPCAEEEFIRVLKPGGVLVLVGAGTNHLMGLKKAIYDNTYTNGERTDLPEKMILEGKRNVSFEIEIEGNDNVKSLFSMTPYYWRTGESDSAKLDSIERLRTEIEFEIYVYRCK